MKHELLTERQRQVKRSLKPYDQWALAQHLLRINSGERSLADTVAILTANGYPGLARAVSDWCR